MENLSTMKTNTDILAAIKECIRNILPNDAQVLFFGSRARGDNRSNSDWDILILINKNRLESEDYDAFVYPLRELGWELDAEINPILYTRKDWEKGRYTPFYKNVEQDAMRLL